MCFVASSSRQSLLMNQSHRHQIQRLMILKQQNNTILVHLMATTEAMEEVIKRDSFWQVFNYYKPSLQVTMDIIDQIMDTGDMEMVAIDQIMVTVMVIIDLKAVITVPVIHINNRALESIFGDDSNDFHKNFMK